MGDDGKRYVFVWNRNRVPEPKEMVREVVLIIIMSVRFDTQSAHFHAAGMRLAANIKPCLLTTHPYYAELGARNRSVFPPVLLCEFVAAKGRFIRSADSDAPETGTFWVRWRRR